MVVDERRVTDESDSARTRTKADLGTVSAHTKTATKTAAPSPKNGNRLPLGAHPGNTGGKKGRSGRKPEAFTNFLARLRQDPRLHDAIEKAAMDASNPGFKSALKVLTDYDDAKPAEKRELSGKLEVRVKIAREGRRVTAS